MRTQSLNGIWQYRVGGGKSTAREVPFSALPVGRSVCERRFDLAEESARVFLRFEGITYHARVTLNGTPLGEMQPYCEYTLEVTAFIKARDNHLVVELEDIMPPFGPSDGWANYGGIIRGVSLL